MKPRLPFAALAVAALTALAGCGGSGSSSSGSKVAELAPPGVPIFVEANLRPTGELKTNTDALAEQIGGVDNLGEFVVSKFEESAEGDGEPFDYATEVEPWLGEHAGAFFETVEDEEPTDLGMIVESTDIGATQDFVDTQVEQSKDPYRSRSYEGVDFNVGGSEDTAVGVVGDFLVVAEDEGIFKEVVDASEGDSLVAEDTFVDAISAATEGSLADVYVDVGDLIEQSGGDIDPTVRQLFGSAGINPKEATTVASIVPGDGQVAVELSSDLAGKEAPTGEASELLGSLPGNAFAGVAFSGFGKQVKEAIDNLDKEGIPDTVPPNQLKKGLDQLGIDLEGFADSLQDAGIFAVGNRESNLSGAMVLTTKGGGATETVDNIVKLLRSAHVEGVTVLGGKYSGFSVRSDDLGDKPLVVAAKEGRVVIGYGLPATLEGLQVDAGSGKTLSDDPAYEDAVDSLDGAPISGFARGPAALTLADALISNSDSDFESAKKYLKHISFLALGSATQDELATAKLIIGVE